MQLDDAWLGLLVEARLLGGSDGARFCREAVAGGVDLIEVVMDGVGPGDERVDWGAIAAVCGEVDALFVGVGDARRAADVGAGGVRLRAGDGSVGLARAAVGDVGVVAMTARTLEEIKLAGEVGADYVVCEAGASTAALLAGSRELAGLRVYAGGLEGPDAARAAVDGGLLRLSVTCPGGLTSGTVRGFVSDFARALGRCV